MKIDNALSAIRLDPAELSSDLTPLANARPILWRRLAFWAPIALATGLGTALGAIATAGVGGWMRTPLLALLAFNLFYMALTGRRG